MAATSPGVLSAGTSRRNQNAEFGDWLGAAFLGRGWASLATRAVVHYLFSTEDLHRIEMQCGAENVRSRAIPERLGFRLEGVRRESHWITSRFVDHAIYGLRAAEWRESEQHDPRHRASHRLDH